MDQQNPISSSLHNLEGTSESSKPLSRLAEIVLKTFEKEKVDLNERKISVNPVVARFAAWYEKLRNAMEYRDEEVILRASIERILRRRLLLGGNAQTTAEPLIRELIWARYVPENQTPESAIAKVEQTIDLYLNLRFKILRKHRLSESTINQWIYHLMSSDLEHLLNPNCEKETMNNFMFQVLKNEIKIEDASEETRSAQIYIAVRRAFAKDDIAFLRFNLFTLYFGKLTAETLDSIADNFLNGYNEIVKELSFPARERVYVYVRRRAAAFLILEDILRENKDTIRHLIQDQVALKEAVLKACEKRYESISNKVTTAIVRSVIFILMTKLVFAFAVEGTYDKLIYGSVQWMTLAINTGIPPLLMIIVSLFIRTPGEENSLRIFNYIEKLLFVDDPVYGDPLFVKSKKDGGNPVLNAIFAILWFLAFVISFGAVTIALNDLHFNIVSKGIFLVFLAIVSFLSYRISLIAHLYRLGEKQGMLTPVIDFFFMPVVRVGRRLTEGISQINFILFVFDFIIETPFKSVFAFAEQWFRFLHDKREELG
ncbi:MAG TPA: hypothetical protein VMR41_04995 [Patescibacteria group bacterium]|nr:hypothetical protein [Patescibacteria group bacterium]